MAYLICYSITMGPIRFFCPGPIVCLSRPCPHIPTHMHTHSLNDIAATGPDSFYFVNFNYFLRMGVPEVFLNINNGSVGHHSGSTSKLLLENLSSPNGVLVSPNRKLVPVYCAVFNITIYIHNIYIYIYIYIYILFI